MKASPRKRLARPNLKNKTGMVIHNCGPSYMKAEGKADHGPRLAWTKI
jgi:hypothetical protein